MIIISNKPGQLGNLLFIYSSFLAYGIESGTTILNPSFFPYKAYFKGTVALRHINRSLYALCFNVARLLRKTGVRKGPVAAVALNHDELVEIDKDPRLSKPLCFTQGWLFRCNALLVKHREAVLYFFSPVPSLQKRLDDFFYTRFSPGDLIVAIHIRRGDYKTFQNGRYYYEIEQYQNFIEQLGKMFAPRDPVFLVCSNETVVFNPEFARSRRLLSGPGHELLDLYAMSKCHYIIGPPSTYTMWASFAGNVPLHMVHDPNRPVSTDDFTIFNPQQHA